MASWGETLKERRLAAGMSPEQLGARAGVTGETIRRIERGHDTTPSTRRKIDEALAQGSELDRLSRLEDEVAQLRRDLAALLGFAERLAGPQEPRPAAAPSSDQDRSRRR